MNMHMVITARNRILLDCFFSTQEKFMKEMFDEKHHLTYSKLEDVNKEKIKNLCLLEGIQRVDILLNLNEAKTLLKFNYNNIYD